MDKQIIIDSYLEFIKDVLFTWVADAGNLEHVLVAVYSLTKRRLKKINTAIDRVKEDFKDIFEAYKELEKEYELKPISVEYQYGNINHRKEIKIVLEKMRNIASDYMYFIEESKKENISINDFITPSNQKSIEFLTNLYEEDLLKIIETCHLSGL